MQNQAHTKPDKKTATADKKTRNPKKPVPWAKLLIGLVLPAILFLVMPGIAALFDTGSSSYIRLFLDSVSAVGGVGLVLAVAVIEYQYFKN